MQLIIVESPTKAQSIQSYLKDEGDWVVMATKGHLYNLPKRRHGVEYKDGEFNAEWELIEGKENLVREIISKARESVEVYIATDDDYEGHRISDDLINAVGIGKLGKPVHRILFRQITKHHILEQIKEQRGGQVSEGAVHAQQARRIIYREVGYPVSAILRKHFENEGETELPKGTGNVVGPALALICDAEEKIDNYIASNYRKIYSDYIVDGVHVRLTMQAKFDEDSAEELESAIERVRRSEHTVVLYEYKESEKTPPKPLITSTLQRGCWYLFDLPEDRVMRIAQRLFEGIKVYGKQSGLITYHRTDSYHVAEEALEAAMGINEKKFGEDHTHYSPRRYTKEGEEGAHEAIRPVMFEERYWPENIEPELLKKDNDGNYLIEEADEVNAVYRFIYHSFLSLQMPNAIYDRSRMVVEAGGNNLSAEANERLYDGFELISDEIRRNYADQQTFSKKEVVLPSIEEGEVLRHIDVGVSEHATRTPVRYGRGRFLTVLANKGIGRPSTLATILTGLFEKGYVKELNADSSSKHKTVQPTLLGRKVHEFHKEHTPWLIDIERAKQLEEDLALVERGEKTYHEAISVFHDDVEELSYKFGIHPNAATPTQIDEAKRIAAMKNQRLDAHFFKNKEKVAKYIKSNIDSIETLCKCPNCKNGEIYENEKSFKCNNTKCRFVIWKKSVIKFFEDRKFDTEGQLSHIIKNIIDNESIIFDGLVSKKGNEYSADIGLKHNPEFKCYNIHMKSYLNDQDRGNPDLVYFERCVDEIDAKVEKCSSKKMEMVDKMDGAAPETIPVFEPEPMIIAPNPMLMDDDRVDSKEAETIDEESNTEAAVPQNEWEWT